MLSELHLSNGTSTALLANPWTECTKHSESTRDGWTTDRQHHGIYSRTISQHRTSLSPIGSMTRRSND